MLIKILGLIDLISGLILMFGANANIPFQILIFFAILLIVKSGIGLFHGAASWIDLGAGLLFILLIFLSIPWIICLIIGLLLIQKGIFSFL